MDVEVCVVHSSRQNVRHWQRQKCVVKASSSYSFRETGVTGKSTAGVESSQVHVECPQKLHMCQHMAIQVRLSPEAVLLLGHFSLLALIGLINLLRPDPLHPIFQPISHLGQTSIVVYTFQPLRLHLVNIARFSSCPLRFLCSWQSDVLVELGPFLNPTL